VTSQERTIGSAPGAGGPPPPGGSPSLLALFLLATTAGACANHAPAPPVSPPRDGWRAVHLIGYETDRDLEALGGSLPALAALGVDVLVLEVDYNFAFVSHPELRRGGAPITAEGARRLADACRGHGIRLIPEFQCLGHQSWEGETFPLLTVYPQFDLTPGAYPGNQGIYCREWDPLNPEVNRIVFALMDEILEAFGADALHVGMDEVFLLGSGQSPSTKGKDPGQLFAKAVNDVHGHVVGRRGKEMLMWGDRLFDGRGHDFGEWESSLNGTAAAIDEIPRDIIVCPWHYKERDAYPSIPMFLEKGFRVLPAGWNDVEATRALIAYAGRLDHPRVLGHLFTTWSVPRESLATYPPLVEGLKLFSPPR